VANTDLTRFPDSKFVTLLPPAFLTELTTSITDMYCEKDPFNETFSNNLTNIGQPRLELKVLSFSLHMMFHVCLNIFDRFVAERYLLFGYITRQTQV
jgi:hypothetical protein